MLWAIFAFELRGRLRRLSTPVYFAVYFALGFLFLQLAAGAFTGASASFGGKVAANAPTAVNVTVAFLSAGAALLAAAVMGDAVLKDVEHGVAPLLFVTPLTKRDYLFGRFLGGLAYVSLVNVAVPLGLWAGTLMPWLDAERLGPNRLLTYVQPYAVMVLPNLLLLGALFFALAAAARRMLPVYMAGVLLLLGYLLATTLAGNVEHKLLGSLLDPLGLTAVGVLTEYWTVAEQNTRLVPLAGVLLENRALWLVVTAAVFAAAYRRFSFTALERRAEARVATHEGEDPAGPPARALAPLVSVTVDLRAAAWLRALPRLALRELRETVRSVYFAVIVFAGVLFLILAASQMGAIYGTPTYPLTYAALELSSGSFLLFILLTLTFYAGDIVWRDRELGIDGIFDATPVPTPIAHAARFLALAAVSLILVGVVFLGGVLTQVFGGFFRIELGLYARQLLLVSLVQYVAVASIVFTAQVLLPSKYGAYVVSVLYFAFTAFAVRLGLEHHLYRLGQMPRATYSDMNGYGPFVLPLAAYGVLWSLFSVFLALARDPFFPRGVATRRGALLWRVREAFRGRAAALGVTLALMAAPVAYILVQTTRVNAYTTEFQRGERTAAFERKYRAFFDEPQPRITAVRVEADLLPSERRAVVRQHLRLDNRGERPVTRVLLSHGVAATLARLAASRPVTTRDDGPLAAHVMELAEPLAPGDGFDVDAELRLGHEGFKNEEDEFFAVGNGSFIPSYELLRVGYAEGNELTDDTARRKHGLTPKERTRAVDDPRGLDHNGIAPDADTIHFDAVVSTDADQVAITSGYLEREWTAGGRRYAHYAMEAPILNIYALLSARYAVRRDTWNDVALEIDYHPGHEFNLERMLRGTKLSLDYFTSAFGPYPHRLVRIVEIPRYHEFAMSLPNTIPYSERIGFIARVNEKDDGDVDYPFYVTCHEVAHQWWGHQLVPADVRGASMVSESLSQYSALMVMRRAFGRAHVGRFLRHEMNRYLMGRTIERKKERPLVEVEDQPYIHYQKGSVVFYALQDLIGEDTVNGALRDLLRRKRESAGARATAREVVLALRAVTPPSMQYFIDDGFEHITLYENRALEAHARPLEGGRYAVTFKTSSRKLRADELGREEEEPMDDFVELAVLDEGGDPLWSERRRVRAGEQEIHAEVAKKPAKAGIDPFNVLVDRVPEDNLVAVDSP